MDAPNNPDNKVPEFKSDNLDFRLILPNLNYNNDQINYQINYLEQIIHKEVMNHPGIKAPGLVEKISVIIPDINADRIRNEIKRELRDFIELRGSIKTGGYYIKK